MEDAPEIEFKNVVVRLGCVIFVVVPKEFGTQQEAHAYIITMGQKGYDKVEEDSKFWYFIKTLEIIIPTNRKPWTIKKFDAKNCRKEFFPAMQFGQIEYYIEILEIEFAKQIAEFIHTLPKDNAHGFNIYPKGDMFNPYGVKVCNYKGI
jgi:hypothetical protein